MKKTIALMLLFLFIAPAVFGYVRPIQYKNISVKFYHPDTNKSIIYDLIDEYYNYTKGLRTIRVFKEYSSNRYCGFYWPSGMIDLYCMDNKTFTHEVAHHQQYIKGDSTHDLIFHNGLFSYFRDLISGIRSE